MPRAIVMRLRAGPIRSYVHQGDKAGEDIEMVAVWDADPLSPNHSFSRATPSARLTAHISNPDAFGFIKEGVEYDVTFVQRGSA